MEDIEKENKESSEKMVPLTVRMDDNLNEKIKALAKGSNQKSAAFARNYIRFAPYIIINNNLEIRTYDGSTMMLFPAKLFELIMNSIKNAPEEVLKEIGDNLANMINLNADFLKKNSMKDKIDFLKLMGWFQLGPGNYLRIPRKFGPPMMVISMVYRLITKKRYPAEWVVNYFYENPLDEKYKKQKDTSTKIQNQKKLFSELLGSFITINDDQNTEYYEFEQVSLIESEITSVTDQAV